MNDELNGFCRLAATVLPDLVHLISEGVPVVVCEDDLPAGFGLAGGGEGVTHGSDQGGGHLINGFDHAEVTIRLQAQSLGADAG